MTTPLCFHLLPAATDPSLVAWAAAGSLWVKLCDAGSIGQVHALGAKVFFRPYLGGDDGDVTDGAAWADRVLQALSDAHVTSPAAIGFRNEATPDAAHVQQYIRYRNRLRQAGYTGLVAMGSFAVGKPDWPEWGTLLEALGGQVPDALELHEYWDLTARGSSPWWAWRHVEAIGRHWLPAEWPLFVGECGSDAIPAEDPQHRGGWDDRGKLSEHDAAAQLAIYAAGCAPSVVAAFVFADGSQPGTRWYPYRTHGTELEGAVRATWPVALQQPAPPAPIPVRKATVVIDLPIPLLNQLPPVNPDNNAYLDCGPANVDMIAMYLGIVTDGYTIRQIKADETGDTNSVGYTDTGEMAAWFTNRGVPARTFQSASPATDIAAALGQGYPVSYLRWFNVPQQSGGHFVVARGYDADKDLFTLNNPYGAFVDVWTSSQINAASRFGWLVVVEKAELNMDDLYLAQWRSRKTDVAVNMDAAILRDWLDKRRTGDHSLGVPLTEEFPSQGGSCQIFTGAIGMWDAATGVTWK